MDLGQANAYAVQIGNRPRRSCLWFPPRSQHACPLAAKRRSMLASTRPYVWLRKKLRIGCSWTISSHEHAQALGLHVKGTLGVIVEAQRHGLLTDEEVELVFQAIMEREDIWISDTLVRRVRDAWRNSTGPSLG